MQPIPVESWILGMVFLLPLLCIGLYGMKKKTDRLRRERK